MARLRTFIAVDFGKAIRDRAVALQEKLAQSGAPVKWVEAENLHVTMLFLGEVDDRDVPAVCSAVAECCLGRTPFSMSIETLGCFPHARRPRVIWIGVGQGTQELCSLHDALEPPLLDLGCYRREDRKYRPHVTLGRVRSDRSADKLAESLAKNTGWRGGETVVRELLVMGSELTSDGPLYTVLSRARLGLE
jgi:2'-5' RNA ligase